MPNWFHTLAPYIWCLLVLVLILVARWIVYGILKRLLNKKSQWRPLIKGTKSIINLLTLYGMILFVLFYFQSTKWMFRALFTIGSQSVSIFLIILVVIIVSLTNRLSRLTTTFIFPMFYKRYDLDPGVQFTFDKIFHYVVMAIAIMIALSTVGFQLSAFTVFAGIVGVGIGFGLQNIASNFISGIILLFERPIKVGDRVVVNEIVGDVERINMRATIIKTLDNEHIIVPNSYFLEEHVINRSYSDTMLRIVISVGVAYGSDVEKVRALLLKAAEEERMASDTLVYNPKPFINFKSFGDSSLDFELFVWIDDPKAIILIKSNLHFRINKLFNENGIEIPFPQRDIHIKSRV